VAEDNFAVAGMMIGKLDVIRPNEELPQLGATIIKPLAAKVHAIQRQEVEAIQERAGIMLARMQATDQRIPRRQLGASQFRRRRRRCPAPARYLD
jgi:hypothetical protein